MAFLALGKRYILQYPDGRLAGTDENSSGYPFPTENYSFIRYWIDETDAIKYAKMFKDIHFKILTVDGLFYYEGINQP